MLALAGALALPSVASAAVFVVDRSGDTPGTGLCAALIANDCSLRDAVTLAAASPDADVVSTADLDNVYCASAITYGGAGPLTITGKSTTFTYVSVGNDHAFHILAGAGPVTLSYLYIRRADASDAADRSILLDESSSELHTSFAVFVFDSTFAGGRSTVEIAPPLGQRGSASFNDTSIFDGPSSGAALRADRSTVIVQGGAVQAAGGGTGILTTGNSSLRVVGTRVYPDSGRPIDLGDGSLVLRHATLTTAGSGPLVAATAVATINTGYSLLAGGATCFGTALTTSTGFNYTDRSALQCPELTAAGDLQGLVHPGLTAIDSLSACGDDGSGGVVSSDVWSMRPTDGDGDGIARCDVGAREHGNTGTLTWLMSGADPHVGDAVEVRLSIDRQYRPGGNNGIVSIPIPPTLALVSAVPSAGITCVTGTTLVCTVSDGLPTLDVEHLGAVDLTLTALATSTTALVATERDERVVRIDPGEQATAISTWTSAPFPVRTTPAPPPLIVDPPIVKHFPNAYAGCTIVGTSGPDHLVGTAKSDVICALGGNDVIDGKGGGDHIIGGDGNDRIDGGAGKDWIEGGPGNDRLSGGPGADAISGGLGHDRIWGGAGNDRLDGGRGFDVLDGQAGKDRATGAAHDRTKRIEHGAAKRKPHAKKTG